jgi:2Fe-2S ferredoxin
MTTVRYFPWNRAVEAEEGDSLLDIALEQGVPLPHACGGDAVCSTCAVRVEQGGEALSTMEDLERETLDKLLPDRTPQTRLACQTQVRQASEVQEIVVNSLEAE